MIQHLRTLLLTESTITDLVGTRIYCHKEPQSPTYPLILLTKISGDPMVVMEGTAGMETAEFDIDCKDSTMSGANALGEVVKSFIADYTGAMGDLTCRAVVLQDDSYDEESPKAGKDVYTYTRLLDCLIQAE